MQIHPTSYKNDISSCISFYMPDLQPFIIPHVQRERGKMIGVGPYIYQRVHVGLARAVSHTNINFRLTFLLTRLQEALYEDLAV